jgi:hypothetical protein
VFLSETPEGSPLPFAGGRTNLCERREKIQARANTEISAVGGILTASHDDSVHSRKLDGGAVRENVGHALLLLKAECRIERNSREGGHQLQPMIQSAALRVGDFATCARCSELAGGNTRRIDDFTRKYPEKRRRNSGGYVSAAAYEARRRTSAA